MSKTPGRPHPLWYLGILLFFTSIGMSWIERNTTAGLLLLLCGTPCAVVALRADRRARRV